MIIRRYQLGEELALWQLYHDTTHLINGRDYTPEQCERWAPDQPDLESWAERLSQTNPFVAEHNSELIGFAELVDPGVIEFFYTHHQWQGKGIGSGLMQRLLQEANRRKYTELRADVSLSAKAFFSSHGFEVIREQHNIVCGAPAPNFAMCKKSTV